MLVYVAALTSMLITLIVGIPYLDFLKKNLYGQFIREDGPSSHAKKAGTPTMGGLMIVIPALIGAVLALIMDQKTNTASCNGSSNNGKFRSSHQGTYNPNC